ncbi:MAG: hypothetical protein ACX94C_07580 [Phycisphaerales bacterium]
MIGDPNSNLPPGVQESDIDGPRISVFEFRMELSTGEKVEVYVTGSDVYPEIWIVTDKSKQPAEDVFDLDDWHNFWKQQRSHQPPRRYR